MGSEKVSFTIATNDGDRMCCSSTCAKLGYSNYDWRGTTVKVCHLFSRFVDKDPSKPELVFLRHTKCLEKTGDL